MGCCCSRAEEPTIFPEPQGPYSVGCADIMTNANTDDKGLFVRIFYPTDKVNIKDHISQLTPSMAEPVKEFSLGVAKAILPPCCACLFKGIIHKGLNQGCLSAALWHAPIAKNGGPFRVLIMSTGFTGNRSANCVFSANLASQGFIVAAPEPRGDAAYTYSLTADGTKQEYWCYKIGPRLPLTGATNYDRHLENKNNLIPWLKLVDARMKECLQTLELLDHLSRGSGCFSLLPNQRVIVLGQEFNWKQFLGRITIENAAMAGHLLGGSTSVSLMSCPQFSYFINLDPQMFMVDERNFSEIEQARPAKALFFVQDSNLRVENNNHALSVKAADCGKCGDQSVIRILKSNHVTYSDGPYYKGCFCYLMNRGTIAMEIAQQIIDDMTLALLTDDDDKMMELLTKYREHIVLEQKNE